MADDTRITEIVESGMNIIATHWKDGPFCTGSAWATLNLIRAELGLPKLPEPWNKSGEERS